MLSERERKELYVIERALSLDDPRLDRMLRQGNTPRTRMVIWLLLAAVPTVAAGFVHPALALLVGSVTVVVLTVIGLVRAKPDRR
jgi:hypothetical protein